MKRMLGSMLVVLLAALALWILAQPMDMRGVASAG